MENKEDFLITWLTLVGAEKRKQLANDLARDMNAVLSMQSGGVYTVTDDTDGDLQVTCWLDKATTFQVSHREYQMGGRLY